MLTAAMLLREAALEELPPSRLLLETPSKPLLESPPSLEELVSGSPLETPEISGSLPPPPPPSPQPENMNAKAIKIAATGKLFVFMIVLLCCEKRGNSVLYCKFCKFSKFWPILILTKEINLCSR
jgi:hypothetical protein